MPNELVNYSKFLYNLIKLINKAKARSNILTSDSSKGVLKT